MRRWLSAIGAAALLTSGSAFAADLGRGPPPAPLAPAPVFTWTGFYLGVQGGGEWTHVSGPFGNAARAAYGPYSFQPSGGLLGGLVGYNWQVNNFVFGLEGDANAAIGVRGLDHNVVFPVATLYDIRAEQTYTADIRGRLGYAVDRVLLYVAGGAAFGDVRTSYAFAGVTPPFLSVTTQRAGWTIGAGLEYAFTNNILGRVEYRYTDLGRKAFTNTPKNTYDNVSFNSSAVLVGLTYKFGAPPAPVVAARY